MWNQLKTEARSDSMVKGKETFGGRVRRKRMEKQITLRKFADMIDVSPTYISQIERDEFKPPVEDKIREIARVLGEDEDEMLGLADRVPSDLPGIIQKHPKEVATFLRTAKGFSRKDWEQLTQKVKEQTGKNKDDD
ncbi:MAG TPA: helix-turn-helix transcriptional regulator [Alphaproteobacteria bacterium]|nr:helix-turn-helix transcriptional regulator [Alphaproteobacteria bacterium]